MKNTQQEQFEHTVLDLIEHSPLGAVPHTPAYQDLPVSAIGLS